MREQPSEQAFSEKNKRQDEKTKETLVIQINEVPVPGRGL